MTRDQHWHATTSLAHVKWAFNLKQTNKQKI